MNLFYAAVVSIVSCLILLTIIVIPSNKSNYLYVVLPSHYSSQKFFSFSHKNNITIIDEGYIDNSFIIQTNKKNTSEKLYEEGLNWHIDMTFVKTCSSALEKITL